MKAVLVNKDSTLTVGDIEKPSLAGWPKQAS